MNSIEASYRGELRDLFDAHFGRFEQQLEHRLVEAGADLRREIAAVTAELRSEITSVRLELERRIDARFETMNRSVAALDERVAKQFHWLVGGQLTVLLAVIGVLAGAFFAR